MDKKKNLTLAGLDENGAIFGIEVMDGEEISEDTFIELSNGKGEAEDE